MKAVMESIILLVKRKLIYSYFWMILWGRERAMDFFYTSPNFVCLMSKLWLHESYQNLRAYAKWLDWEIVLCERNMCLWLHMCVCVAFLLEQLISLSGAIKAEKGTWKLSLKRKSWGEKKKTNKKTTVQNIHWIKLTFQTRIIIYLDNLIDLYWNFISLVGQYFPLTTGWYFCFQYVLVAFILRWKWENIEAKK